MTQKIQVAFICLCLIISIFAFEEESNELYGEKRAFVKCIGNPVACYGKRGTLQKIEAIDNMNNNNNYKYPKVNIDWIMNAIKIYHQNCKYGDVKSCREISRLLSAF